MSDERNDFPEGSLGTVSNPIQIDGEDHWFVLVSDQSDEQVSLPMDPGFDVGRDEFDDEEDEAD